MTLSQLLTEPEPEPQQPTQPTCSQAGPEIATEVAMCPAPGKQDSLSATEADQALPELSSSLDQVELDFQGLDELMWEELDDLGLDVSSHHDM